MAESIFSSYWYQVAELHPQLVSTTRITRQIFRNQPWYVLSSKTSGRQYRVNPLGYELVGRLDGSLSVQEIWEFLVRRMGNDAPNQHEVLNILSELSLAGMLLTEHSMNLGGIFESAKRHNQRNGTRLNPLSFKVSLWDPSRLLDWLQPLGQRLLSPFMACLVIMLTLVAAVLADMHWAELSDYGIKHLTSQKNLLLMWLTYPLIKIVHELGHALTIRVWGGAVHEFGITLFFMTPVPYIDASAASAFDRKGRRIMVNAMGVIVELVIGSLALLGWLNISDGWLRELCFACIGVCGLSSLLINANPLMRFDGYYFLTDAFEIPGLAARSEQYLRYLGERWLLGNHLLKSPIGAGDSALLFLVYGLAALIYRLLLLGGMVIWLGSKQLALGVLLAVWLGLQYLLRPLYRLITLVLRSPRLAPVRIRSLTALGILLLLAGGGTLLYPAPYITHVTGQVWVPDESIVRNDVEGFVDKVLVTNGQTVRAGQEILRLGNPELLAMRRQTQARLDGQLQAYQGSLLKDRADTITLSQDIDKLNHQLQEIDRRIAALNLRAPQTGTLSLPQSSDLPGRYFSRGAALAEVINPEKMTIRMVLSQQDIDLLRDPLANFHVRIAENPTRTFKARLVAQQPSTTWQLPSAIFGAQLGGPFATDPADKDGLRTQESIFIVDIEVSGHPLARIGTRAWVHIENAPKPLAIQWWRSLHQLLLRHFGGGKITSAQDTQ